jgi:small subunit ribosomal protein S4
MLFECLLRHYTNQKFKSAQRYKDILEVTGSRMVPAWLEADHAKFTGTVKDLPNREDVTVAVEENMIVEYYSR